DIRTIPSVKHAALRDHLASYLGPDVALSAVVDIEGMWTDPDDPWVQQVMEVAGRVAGGPRDVPAAPYFTDASVFAPAMGDARTVILGHGEPGLAHQRDGYCLIGRVEKSVEIYAELIRRWCRL